MCDVALFGTVRNVRNLNVIKNLTNDKSLVTIEFDIEVNKILSMEEDPISDLKLQNIQYVRCNAFESKAIMINNRYNFSNNPYKNMPIFVRGDLLISDTNKKLRKMGFISSPVIDIEDINILEELDEELFDESFENDFDDDCEYIKKENVKSSKKYERVLGEYIAHVTNIIS